MEINFFLPFLFLKQLRIFRGGCLFLLYWGFLFGWFVVVWFFCWFFFPHRQCLAQNIYSLSGEDKDIWLLCGLLGVSFPLPKIVDSSSSRYHFQNTAYTATAMKSHIISLLNQAFSESLGNKSKQLGEIKGL